MPSYLVRCRHAVQVPYVQSLVDGIDAWLDSPWESLLYVIMWLLVVRFLVRSRKVRMACSVLALLLKVGLELVTVYARRVKQRVRGARAVEFTGDPNQKVMRRPIMKAPGRAGVAGGAQQLPPLPPGVAFAPLVTATAPQQPDAPPSPPADGDSAGAAAAREKVE
jgi:hypothetical protein